MASQSALPFLQGMVTQATNTHTQTHTVTPYCVDMNRNSLHRAQLAVLAMRAENTTLLTAQFIFVTFQHNYIHNVSED